MMTPFLFAGAYILDLLAGDPRRLVHPVRVIGWAICRGESIIRRRMQDMRLGGVVLWMAIVAGTFVCAFAVQWVACRIHVIAGTLVVIAGAWTTLAVRSLYDESKAVMIEITKNDLVAARDKLSGIVGRDTGDLNREEILQAVIETVAENLSDGVIAPMFYMMMGGFPLALAYKAVNTLDSMVGYRDERYRDIGWFSARADDAVNWIPARLTGIIVILVSFAVGADGRRAWRIMRRDGRKHLSPNSGIPEAAVAGALGVELGGAHDYFGERVEKPVIGDKRRKIDTDVVMAVWYIMFLSSFIMVAACLIILAAVHYG